MYILTSLKLDQKQMPYFSCMLMEGKECVVEVYLTSKGSGNQVAHTSEILRTVQLTMLLLDAATAKG